MTAAFSTIKMSYQRGEVMQGHFLQRTADLERACDVEDPWNWHFGLHFGWVRHSEKEDHFVGEAQR